MSYVYINKIKRVLSHLRRSPFYLQLPNYIPWKEEEFITVIEDNLNWKGTFGEQHTDCWMSDAKEYLKLKKFGVVELTAKLSSLVRDKQLTRDKAVTLSRRYMGQLIKNEAAIREQIKKQFNLSENELDKIIRTSHVNYISKMDNILAKAKNIYEIVKYRKER